ncbi:hypothetical protein [Archangium violaceum]|uniref:hypothetical protein n=1 Tax=Archangium violaceum TaxID=83451 RepID=UPI0037BF3D8C
MDPYAASGMPPELGSLASSPAPLQSDLGNILNSVANAISTANQALETVKGLVGEGTATAANTLKKAVAEPLLAKTAQIAVAEPGMAKVAHKLVEAEPVLAKARAELAGPGVIQEPSATEA